MTSQTLTADQKTGLILGWAALRQPKIKPRLRAAYRPNGGYLYRVQRGRGTILMIIGISVGDDRFFDVVSRAADSALLLYEDSTSAVALLEEPDLEGSTLGQGRALAIPHTGARA